jgi:hypothetical protein
MRRRILEWSWIIALLLSIGLTVLWADSILTKRQSDVLSLTNNVNLLVTAGRLTFFGDPSELERIQPRVFRPRGFGVLNLPKERAYFDWMIPAFVVRYCFVTGEVSFPLTPGMVGPRRIRYAEFTIPGLSYHLDHESQLAAARWSLELSLLVPLVLLLAILGLSWFRSQKGHSPSNTQTPDQSAFFVKKEIDIRRGLG